MIECNTFTFIPTLYGSHRGEPGGSLLPYHNCRVAAGVEEPGPLEGMDTNRRLCYPCFVIPGFRPDGTLPSGVHHATWREIVLTFGTTPHRRLLLGGLLRALRALRAAGCTLAYVDGSFVTARSVPADYDGCYDLAGLDPERLPPTLRDFSDRRARQKAEFMGEMFPASWAADRQGRPYLEFFQQDRAGNPKGIIAVDLVQGGVP